MESPSAMVPTGLMQRVAAAGHGSNFALILLWKTRRW